MRGVLKANISIFGRTLPIFAVAAVLLVGTAVALLTNYITITGNATVAQSVLLDDFESTWKYNANVSFVPHTTQATWSVIGAVAGDEQDVGFELSNFAEVQAPVVIVSNTTGPNHLQYQKCTDVNVTIWSDYTPANNGTCAGAGTLGACNAIGYCTWNGTACKGNEKCKGAVISTACNTNTDSVSASTTLNPRPNELDPNTPFERWYCARHAWNVAAVPGTYSFSLKINPGP